MNFENPTIGSDPEMFLLSNKRIVPAGTVIADDGSKTELKKDVYDYNFRRLKRGMGRVVYDNAAVELRAASSGCLENWVNALKTSVEELRSRLRGHKIVVSVCPAFRLSRENLQKPGVMLFGCNPAIRLTEDMGLEDTVPKLNPARTSIRSAGCHIHLGWNNGYCHQPVVSDKDSLALAIETTLVADILVGLPAVLMEKRFARQVRWRRDELGYGRAGEFRRTSYGMEYRSLGPWPMYCPSLMWWAGCALRDCYFMVTNKLAPEIIQCVPRDKVVRAIDTADTELARKLWYTALNKLGSTVDSLYKGRGSDPTTQGRPSTAGWCRGHDVFHKDNLAALDYYTKANGYMSAVANSRQSLFTRWDKWNHHTNMSFPAMAAKNPKVVRFITEWEYPNA